ncbi:MAG TPA: hypothetical protein VGH28_27750 [Polyangiaceae bacterium]
MTKLAVLAMLCLVACSSDDSKDAGSDASLEAAPDVVAAVDGGPDAPAEAGCPAQSCLDQASNCADDCDSNYDMCEGNSCLTMCLAACEGCAGQVACAADFCADASTP